MCKDCPPAEQPLVIFMPSGRRGRVPAGTSLLDAARQVGVEIESICNGRLTCGKCKVHIEEGTFPKHGIVSGAGQVTPPTSEETDFLKRLTPGGCRLACAAYVQGGVLVTVPEESQARKQIIRKSATERVIEVRPAVRQVYVEVEEATLEDRRGDWERLQAALAPGEPGSRGEGERGRGSLDNRSPWFDRLTTSSPQLPSSPAPQGGVGIDYFALRDLQHALRKGQWAVTVTLWHDRQVIDVRPGYQEGAYGLAVDIGTTTVAGYLCDLRTGAVLATEALMNPQVTYGEDLMSRVSYAMSHSDGLTQMHRAIIDALNQLAGRAAAQAGIKTRDIYEAVLVGNPVMEHILLGIDPVELGGAPFAPATHAALDIKARDLGIRLHPAAHVHLLPLEAGHVGADNVAVLLAEAPHQQDEMMLIIDVGTNGEILLGNRQRVLSASSPTGPAFEGAQITHGMRAAAGAIERVRIDPATWEPRFKLIGDDRWFAPPFRDKETRRPGDKERLSNEPLPLSPSPLPLVSEGAAGICGSGIIEAVAELYLAGIIRSDGRFNPEADHPRVQWLPPLSPPRVGSGRRRGEPVEPRLGGVGGGKGTGAYVLATADQTSTGRPILVTQADVRAIQLAKAALYTGAKLLMNAAGVRKVDKIVLAGAFGSYIDPKHAMVLGLIPDCDLGQVYAVGNAAGDGARIALLNRDKRHEAQGLARQVEHVNTAIAPNFQEEFVAALHLPHMSDPFPHLEGVLPNRPASTNRRENRRRPRIED